MSRLPQIKARQLIRALQALGFVFVRQKGSHAFFRHPATGKATVVPIHGGEDIDRSLLHGMLQEIEVSVEEFLTALDR